MPPAPRSHLNGPGQSPPERIEAAEKRKKGLQLLKLGATWDQIAKECGWANKGTAHRLVMAELAEIPRAEADELRALHHERLNGLFMAQYPKALKGDGWATDRCLRILEREAKLFGLDAPQAVRVETIPEDAVDSRIIELEAEVARRAIEAGEAGRPSLEATETPGA